MEMASYIHSILKSDIIKLFSWGAHNFKAIEDGLQMNVQGFLFTGLVKVIYEADSDTFKVRLEKFSGELWSEQDMVYFDNLIDVIDSMVEKDCSEEAYVERVKSKYHV